jgi:hypothetical protein
MPPADLASFHLTLLCVSLTTAVLAGLLLAIECYATAQVARRAPGVIAVVLAGVGLATCWVRGAAWPAAGCFSLSALLLAAWPVSFEAARRHLQRLVMPKFVWAAALVASMVAARYLAAHVLHATGREVAPQVVDLEDVPVRRAEALTDKGRTVALFHFKVHSTDAEVERFMQSAEKDHLQMIRLTESNPAANCHGWVFTGGRFGVRDGDMGSVLNDNGYVLVDEPREGDLAVYMDGIKITHSGLVRLANRTAPILIESKWGPFGVYLHAVDKQPFAGVCKFFRSSRAGHLLIVRELADAADAAQIGPASTMISQR